MRYQVVPHTFLVLESNWGFSGFMDTDVESQSFAVTLICIYYKYTVFTIYIGREGFSSQNFLLGNLGNL